MDKKKIHEEEIPLEEQMMRRQSAPRPSAQEEIQNMQMTSPMPSQNGALDGFIDFFGGLPLSGGDGFDVRIHDVSSFQVVVRVYLPSPIEICRILRLRKNFF